MGPMDFTINIVGINPEPWEIGPLQVGRGKNGHVFPKVGRAERLHTYKEAIREELLLQAPECNGAFDDADALAIRFDLWRQLEQYERGGKKQTGNLVDATNLQKGLEDALQGILFPNDKVVREVTTRVWRQETGIVPLIRIYVARMTPEMHEMMDKWYGDMIAMDFSTPTQDDGNAW